MKLTKKQERWIKELEELGNFFEARLKGYSLKTDQLVEESSMVEINPLQVLHYPLRFLLADAI
jgi:hypothetical protein